MNKKRFFITLLKIAVLYLVVTAFQGDKELNIFVSPHGNDGNNGTMTSPLRTLEKAKLLVQKLRTNESYNRISVNLMPGEYQLDKPLLFNAADGGTSNCSVTYKAHKAGTAIISGGRQLPKKWIKDESGTVWKLKLDGNYGLINQLFANGQRLRRSHSRIFYTIGPLKIYRKTIESFLVKGYDKLELSYKLREKDITPFCGFSYKHGDLNDISADDINNAEVLLYHSWDCSWHNIGKIDKANNEVYFKNPSVYPVGIFSNRNRYVVENCKSYLKDSGDWCYDKEKRELFFMAKAGEDPNDLNFVVPHIETLAIINGEHDSEKRVQNITFSGLSFKYTIAPRGLQWHNDYLSLLVPDKNMPWLDLKTGVGILQGAIESGQAISIQNANRISFMDCNFTQLGAYAVNIYNYADDNQFVNCQFSDVGAGGIIFGSRLVDLIHDKPSQSLPKNNAIRNCKIYNYGVIYQSGLGISIMHAVKSRIIKNEIFNAPYTGLSCGWTWGRGKSYTRETFIQSNNIHHVMQQLADGGGIYTLGNQPGTIIENNKIHDIQRSEDAVGSRNNGIFFDEGSSRIHLDKNEIYNIENETIRYNKSNPSDITWGTNKFDNQEATGDDGQSLVSTKTLAYAFENDRFRTIVSNIYNSEWFFYGLAIVIVASIFLIVKIRKRQKRKKYRKQFSSKK